MIIMTDSMRNKVVGVFNSTTEALKYAKEEGISVVTFETVKGGSYKEMDTTELFVKKKLSKSRFTPWS